MECANFVHQILSLLIMLLKNVLLVLKDLIHPLDQLIVHSVLLDISLMIIPNNVNYVLLELSQMKEPLNVLLVLPDLILSLDLILVSSVLLVII